MSSDIKPKTDVERNDASCLVMHFTSFYHREALVFMLNA